MLIKILLITYFLNFIYIIIFINTCGFFLIMLDDWQFLKNYLNTFKIIINIFLLLMVHLID